MIDYQGKTLNVGDLVSYSCGRDLGIGIIQKINSVKITCLKLKGGKSFWKDLPYSSNTLRIDLNCLTDENRKVFDTLYSQLTGNTMEDNT